MAKTVIIYYHEVVDGIGFSYQKINVSHFEKQMTFLFNNSTKYNVISFDDYLNGKCDKKRINVIISFDDGYATVFSKAHPILKKYNFCYSIYLATSFVGKDNYLALHEIKTLNDEENVSFEAHTHNHINCKQSTENMIATEVRLSDNFFADNKIKKPVVFCFPYGKFDRKSTKLLYNLKRYKMLLGSFYGFVSNNRKRVVPRIGIKDSDDLLLFEKKITGRQNWKGSLQKIRMIFKS